MNENKLDWCIGLTREQCLKIEKEITALRMRLEAKTAEAMHLSEVVKAGSYKSASLAHQDLAPSNLCGKNLSFALAEE